MASVPSESNQSSPRIDNFSSLPNELLDNIFEYLYTQTPPPLPLSKRLRPWFEKHFYRKVSLSSSGQFSNFATLASGRPSIGRHVRSLKFENKGTFKVGLHQLFHHLPNLVKLDIPCLPALYDSADPFVPPAPYLLRLEHLVTSLPRASETEAVDLDSLAQLASLPTLKQLEIYDWHEDGNYVNRPELVILPGIKALKIQGDGADTVSARTLVNACPSLLHLELNSTYDESPLGFQHTLPTLPCSLHSLHIYSPTFTFIHPPVDSALPSFSQLRSLRLGDGIYSVTVHVALQNLPLLTHLHLGEGEIDPDGFVSLISGSPRLPSLRTIILDFDAGTVGSRIKRPSRAEFNIEFEMKNFDVNMGDWSLSGAHDGHRFDLLGLQQLIEVARDNGVVVEGSIFSALENAVAYRIEENNRATIYALGEQQIDDLEGTRFFASLDGVFLPPLDLDSLDWDRVEIVEIELPEREWFMLNLRNKPE